MEARKLARKTALLFASHVDVGMTEKEGIALVDELLEKQGVTKKWHPTKFRIGPNTVKTFREKSAPETKVQKNDIYFLDIGPVYEGHEADYGQTFTLGQNEDNSKIQRASKKVFDQVSEIWKRDKISGEELYIKARELAKNEGYVLNEDMDGHRLGDFPHALFYKKSLSDFPDPPKENLWILEIHLRHPEKEIGAFFEDLLM